MIQGSNAGFDRRDQARPTRERAIRLRALQLAGALLLAVVLPGTIGLDSLVPGEPALVNAWFGTLVAVLAGTWFIGRFVTYPGVRASAFILPTFTSTYGIVLAIFFFLRLDYSRFQFLASFTACIIWYFAVYFMAQQARSPQIALLPVGDTRKLTRIGGVDWQLLTSVHDVSQPYDSLVADFRAEMPDEWERFIADAALSGMPVFHIKQIEETLTGRVDIEHLSENNLGSRIPGSAYLKLKMMVDIALALAALLPLALIMLAIAAAIRTGSDGPAIFRQQRVGYRGRIITIFKFRTMYVDGATGGSAREKAVTHDNDPRVTRIGHFLRRSRLDELPQIFNILRGEMSWIGPRPEAVPLSHWYEQELPFYRYRHIVRPGISGWAQVNQGHVADVADVRFKLHYDFYYIKYFSPWLDVLITIKTIRTMATGFGAR